MCRKDYELLAGCIRELPDTISKDELIRKLAAELLNTNPRFNPSRFIAACNPARVDS